MLSACTLLYGPSDSEFANGTVTGPDGSSSSAGGEVGPDGAPLSSGGTRDGGADSSGTVPFVCPNQALVCEDFEGTTNAAFSPMGPTTVVAGGHASAHALEATAGNNDNGYLKATFDNASKATLSFWFRAPKAPDDPDIHFRVADLLFGDGCDWPLSWQVWLGIDGLHEGTDSYNQAVNPSCGPIKFDSQIVMTANQIYDGNWHHVVGVTDASATVRTSSVTVDDQKPVTDSADSGRNIVPKNLQLDIGISCTQTTAGCFAWDGTPFEIDVDQITLTMP
jgi:hypothetical protein